jgi:pilus assembly protein CpaE
VSLVETLLVLDDSLDQAVVQSSLPVGGKVRAVRLGYGAESVLAALDGMQPDLIVIGSASMSDEALDVIRGARRRHGESAIVVLHVGSPNGYLERAFSAGADDLITLPQGRDAIAFALEKAVARRRRVPQAASRSPMICIIGPKGGTGKTLTACNLAVALALAGKRPVIVDIDLQFGDVGIALGLIPEHTIYDLAVSPGPIDAEKVGRFLTHHSSGADVLLAPTRPDQAGAIGPDALREIFPVLRSLYDFVIVETPPAFTPEVIASIDSSSTLCVVGMLDALSLKDTKIGLETLALMGYDLDDVQLVLNRADTSVGISDDDVTMILGRRPDIFVPSDRAVPRAITDGLPIVVAAEKSGPAKAFFSLASLYLGADSTESGSTEAPARAKEASRGSRRSLFARGQ